MHYIRRLLGRKEVGYHLLLWLLLIGPHSFFSAYLIEDHLDLLIYCIAVADGLLILIIYFTVYVLIPRYFVGKEYLTFSACLIGLFALYILSCVKMENDIAHALGRDPDDTKLAFYYLISISRYTLIGFLLFRLSQSFLQKKKLDEIAVQKLEAEVSYLRAQINPHFLFNTLNNLYGLALERSDKTPDLIVRLSKMMDYMLYEVEGTKVLLKRDVENVENYIAMERIRQGNNATIHFHVNGEIRNQLIEPLLMLPLVENAFKHGVSQLIEEAYLDVHLSITDEEFLFCVKNNYKQGKPRDQLHESLGLVNLRKRLNLFYPGRYSLDIFDDSLNYHVTLRIVQPFMNTTLKLNRTPA
jgi:two-component system, LytTR family, sensor kinase